MATATKTMKIEDGIYTVKSEKTGVVKQYKIAETEFPGGNMKRVCYAIEGNKEIGIAFVSAEFGKFYIWKRHVSGQLGKEARALESILNDPASAQRERGLIILEHVNAEGTEEANCRRCSGKLIDRIDRELGIHEHCQEEEGQELEGRTKKGRKPGKRGGKSAPSSDERQASATARAMAQETASKAFGFADEGKPAQGAKKAPEATEKAVPVQPDIDCPKCSATGTYSDGKVTGVCFACGGKGYQNDKDQRRNWGYWTFHARTA